MTLGSVAEAFKAVYSPKPIQDLVETEIVLWKSLNRSRLNPARRAFLKAVCTTGERVHRSTPQITHIMRQVVLRELQQNSTSSAFAGTVKWKILTHVENPKYLGVIKSIGA